MNLAAIKKGDRISNYRALCKLLEEEEKSGASKRAQIKTWEQYFSFEREKNAFIITEIYDVPKVKDDNRMTFMKYSVPLLLYYLAVNDINVEEKVLTQWIVDTEFAPEIIFEEDYYNRYEWEDNFEHLVVQSVRMFIIEISKKTFLNALSYAEKEKIITVDKKLNIILANDHMIEGTAEDESYIKKVKEQLYEEFEVKNMYSIQRSKKRTDRFYERMEEIFRAEKGWKKTFNTITVEILNNEIIDKYNGIEKKETIKGLYREYFDSIMKNIRNQEEKADFTDWESNSFKLTPMQATAMWFILQEILL